LSGAEGEEKGVDRQDDRRRYPPMGNAIWEVRRGGAPHTGKVLGVKRKVRGMYGGKPGGKNERTSKKFLAE